MAYAGCSSRESFRLNNERRYHDWKRPYGKDEAVPMREPHYGPLVHVGVLSCLEVFFVLRGCIAHQSSTDAYGGYDELLHGFWGNQLNHGKLMPFLDGKASILFLLASSTLAPVVQAAGSNSLPLVETRPREDLRDDKLQRDWEWTHLAIKP
jgi:hypothetical protein